MEKTGESRYSVLMSVYAKEKPEWLALSIESMLAQTIAPSEFVIVKDGPLPEKLNQVIENYCKQNRGLFNVISLPENVGLGPALKIGVENCTYELIARMDSDDYSLPNRIEKQLKVFEENPSVGIVGTNVIEFQDELSNPISQVILPEKHHDIVKFSKRRCPFRHPSLVYKKSEVISAGNYREYYLCEDYDLYVRMIRNNTICYNIQENLTYMRINSEFYKRRGGLKYLKSIMRFKNEQLKNGFFTVEDYLKSSIPHIIVCLLPNILRDFIYKHVLRKRVLNK